MPLTPALQEKAAAIKATDKNKYDSASFTGKSGIRIVYRLLRPLHAKPGRRYPLVVVYHGSGVEGSDNSSQLGILSKIWAEDEIRNKYPAYILVPQFPQRSSNYAPDAARKVLTSHPQPCLDAALELADSLRRALNIDDKRIYAMGFSMGGSTTMNSLALRPGLFAAGISFSGIPAFEDEDKLINTPLWLIHGNADTENPFASDSLFYREMMAKGAKKLRFLELDGVAHELLPQLWVNSALPEWLFRQRKK